MWLKAIKLISHIVQSTKNFMFCKVKDSKEDYNKLQCVTNER